MSTPSSSMQLALRRHQLGELDDAERMYREVLKSEPHNADAHHLLGLVALQQSQHERAIEHLRQAIACNPSAAPYHRHLGTALQATGQTSEAIRAFREALRLAPSAVAHNDLGNA